LHKELFYWWQEEGAVDTLWDMVPVVLVAAFLAVVLTMVVSAVLNRLVVLAAPAALIAKVTLVPPVPVDQAVVTLGELVTMAVAAGSLHPAGPQLEVAVRDLLKVL